ncbi:hypothetical protein DEM27_32195 [Metarhizobium album]|uniref:Uncharacterized protein n=1 Tax=Metarhizobium album TaxID=2182425 RepID=A0A2U2DFY8_9HYPH|nr:hypothetical protein DEM27_32195 [Rhizobium album]
MKGSRRIFNLLSYSDDEIEAILAAATAACRCLDVDLNTEQGRHILQRATNLAGSGVVDEAKILAMLCARGVKAAERNSA